MGETVDIKRFTEWLGTVEGLVKAGIGVIAAVALIYTKTSKSLDPIVEHFNLPGWSRDAVAGLIFMVLVWIVWRSFSRFNQASRLEHPDAFTLHPTGPASLIGREEDLARLIKSVKQNRLVLLDGESGCGKSALVTAGLVPLLQQSDGLLPVVIRDWGEDWERGPLSAALDALFHSLSAAERARLAWITSPDLAADTTRLASDLDARLRAVIDTFGRRPLLIADQFDDYQALHRLRFLDGDANWLTPTDCAKANRFWELVNIALHEGRLHLLIITRADTAAGLACVRFLGDDQTAIRTLPRVDMDYLRPLLAGIAPEDAKPVVVSNPTCGWLELRERLERDLEAEGAILMQQVRTALLGLRQLPLLTTKCYRAAGGLRGIEVLVVSRAVRRAGEAGGGGEAGLRTARIVLGGLILPGGPNQPPKGQRAPLSALSDVAGDRGRTEAILRALQDDEVVRPAEVIGGLNAWQLDHDYLARAVLAETLQAARWSLALREGKARYDEAAGDLRRRWAALLPFPTLVRVCWERARKRLTFGDAASYVSRSAVASLLLAPLLLVPLLVLIVGTFSRASQSMEDFGNFSVRLEVVATSKIKCPEDTVPLLWAEPINVGDVKPFQRGNYIARGCEKAGLEVHGPWIALYSNGQIVQEGTFDNGRRNGKVTTYYHTGAKAAEWQYEKGRRIGDEIVWDLDGKEVTRRKQ